MKNILFLSFSQTGQLNDILDRIAAPLLSVYNLDIDHFQIQPEPAYPIPWNADEFFSVMPDSVLGKSCKIKPLNIKNPEKYDLVILGYQVWYLSPSIPVSSFVKSDEGKKILEGKKVITVLGVRNMWIMAHEIMHNLLVNANAVHTGNIVLEDKNNNLISVLTIIRWLMHGDKGPYRHLPEAGVSSQDIKEAARFGECIGESIENMEECFQHRLLQANAVKVNYPIYQMEKNARRIFTIWAGIINNKKKKNAKKELRWIRFFKNYLLFMIFVISPVAYIIFSMKRLLFFRKTSLKINQIKNIC